MRAVLQKVWLVWLEINNYVKLSYSKREQPDADNHDDDGDENMLMMLIKIKSWTLENYSNSARLQKLTTKYFFEFLLIIIKQIKAD